MEFPFKNNAVVKNLISQGFNYAIVKAARVDSDDCSAYGYIDRDTAFKAASKISDHGSWVYVISLPDMDVIAYLTGWCRKKQKLSIDNSKEF